MIALYFYKALAYLIYLAYCSINDLVTVSVKFLHCSSLEIGKEKIFFFFSSPISELAYIKTENEYLNSFITVVSSMTSS